MKTAEEKAETKRKCTERWRLANKERTKLYARAYYAQNKEHKRAVSKIWRDANRDEVNRKQRERLVGYGDRYSKKAREARALNPESIRARERAYAEANLTLKRQWRKDWYHKNKENLRNDYLWVLKCRVRARLTMALKHKTPRMCSTARLGCSYPELAEHLSKQFVDGMSWDNRNLWHIDHIKPLASFDLTDPEQVAEACHYTNLQPLWAKENLKKGSKLIMKENQNG